MPNNDYILRSDALKAIRAVPPGNWSRAQYVDAVERVPAADVEPKRKTGRWKIAGAFDDFYQCPECGEMWPIFSTIEWKCCPICECKIITNRPKGEEDAE